MELNENQYEHYILVRYLGLFYFCLGVKFFGLIKTSQQMADNFLTHISYLSDMKTTRIFLTKSQHDSILNISS